MKKHSRILIVSAALLILTLTGLFSINASAKDTENKMYISSGWTLKSTNGFADIGQDISKPDYTPNGWMPAVVPGTVLTTYVENSIYPDPYYDINNKRGEGLIPDAKIAGSTFSFAHWYRTSFTLTEDYRDKMIWLNFDGINHRADIYLNGKPIGNIGKTGSFGEALYSMHGAFIRGIFNVTDEAVIGENYLAVRIYQLSEPGAVKDWGCGGDRSNGDIGRNPACMEVTVGWDFSFVDGVRDRNMGIYRDVFISTTGPVSVKDPFMYTEGVPTEESANLSFKTYVTNTTDAPQTGTLELDIEGIKVTTTVSLAANEQKEVIMKYTDFPGLVISNPRLWWPAGRGAQELYDYKISFTMAGGAVSDKINSYFGIRSIKFLPDFNGQLNGWVNGKRFFMSGGSWVNDAMCRGNTAERYDAQIRMIAQAGWNWLRCWSGCGPEDDLFFEACDKYGVLVWVESGLTNQTAYVSTSTTENALSMVHRENWKDTILRVRKYPSVFYYCACNEGTNNWVNTLNREVELYDGTRGFQPNSATNGTGGSRNQGSPYSYQGANYLYDYMGTDVWGASLSNAGAVGLFGGFCNESGSACLPPADVLKDWIPEEKLWPINKASFDYRDGAGFHNIWYMLNYGCAQYGNFALPDIVGRTGLENYAFKGQMAGALTFRAISDLWQRNKWNATGKWSTGYAFWTANNTYPEVCSRIYNYTLEPNASLYYMAHGNKPLHVAYDYFANDVSAINNSFDPASNLTVKAEIRNLDWSLKWSRSYALANLPEETTLNGLINVPAKENADFDDTHFIIVMLYDEDGERIDEMIYWRGKYDEGYGAEAGYRSLNTMKPSALNVTASIEIVGDTQFVTVTAENPTDTLAFFNRFKIYNKDTNKLIAPIFYTDNYFSVLPGESKTIIIEYKTKELNGADPILIVEGWNVGGLTINVPGSGTTAQVTPKGQKDNRAVSAVVFTSSTAAPANIGEHAVDGLSTTSWIAGGTGSQYITVDLGSYQPIDKIILDWGAGYATSYVVSVSQENQTNGWTDIYTSAAGAGGRETLEFDAVYARFVRLRCTEAASAAPYEVKGFEIYGPGPEPIGINLARRKPATASGTSGSNSAALAVNGGNSDRWVSNNAQNGTWLMVDLQDMYTISSVKMLWGTTTNDNMTTNNATFAKSYQIQVSDNNQTWRTVYSTTNGAGGNTQTNLGSMEVVKFAPTTCRYVRVYCTEYGVTGRTGYAMYQFMVYGYKDSFTFNVKFIDDGGNDVTLRTKMPTEGDLTVDYTLINENILDMDALVLVAMYDPAGRLAQLKSFPVSVIAQKQFKDKAIIELPEDRSGYTIKVMLWDQLTYVPLTEAALFPNPNPVPLTEIWNCTDSRIIYSSGGGWSLNASKSGYYLNNCYSTRTVGAYFEYSFDGIQSKIYGGKNSYMCIVEIFLDGVSKGELDLYQSSTANQQLYYDTGILPSGVHTIRFVHKGRNPSALEGWIELDWLEVTRLDD